MDLLYVHGKTTSGVELARTLTTLEVFGLLVLHEDCVRRTWLRDQADTEASR